MATDPTDCRCYAATARARQSGREERCAVCDAWVTAPSLPVPQRYAPDPPPSLPPLLTTAPPVLVGRSARGDMEDLARWLSVLLGRAAGLEPATRGARRDGRPDHVDEHHDGLARASAVLARLGALYAAGDDGRTAVLVLWGAHVRGDLDDEAIGLLFAEPAVRRAWLASDKHGVRRGLPRVEGAQLAETCRQLYQDPVAPRAPLAGWLDAVAAEVARRSRAVLADRAADRQRRDRATQLRKLVQQGSPPPPPTVAKPPNRRERRKALQRGRAA